MRSFSLPEFLRSLLSTLTVELGTVAEGGVNEADDAAAAIRAAEGSAGTVGGVRGLTGDEAEPFADDTEDDCDEEAEFEEVVAVGATTILLSFKLRLSGLPCAGSSPDDVNDEFEVLVEV